MMNAKNLTGELTRRIRTAKKTQRQIYRARAAAKSSPERYSLTDSIDELDATIEQLETAKELILSSVVDTEALRGCVN